MKAVVKFKQLVARRRAERAAAAAAAGGTGADVAGSGAGRGNGQPSRGHSQKGGFANKSGAMPPSSVHIAPLSFSVKAEDMCVAVAAIVEVWRWPCAHVTRCAVFRDPSHGRQTHGPYASPSLLAVRAAVVSALPVTQPLTPGAMMCRYLPHPCAGPQTLEEVVVHGRRYVFAGLAFLLLVSVLTLLCFRCVPTTDSAVPASAPSEAVFQ